MIDSYITPEDITEIFGSDECYVTFHDQPCQIVKLNDDEYHLDIPEMKISCDQVRFEEIAHIIEAAAPDLKQLVLM